MTPARRNLMAVIEKPPAGLKAAQAEELARHYASLSRRATLSRRADMLEQAKTYLLYAGNDATTLATSEKVNAELTLLRTHQGGATAFVD